MMENISDPTTSQTFNGSVMNHPDRDRSAQGVSGFFPAIVNMIAEGGDNFFRYLKTLGLSRENNLRKLNMIKYLDEFLFTLVQVLPPDTKFLGCFSDCKASEATRVSFLHPMKLLRRTINILDSNGERTMNKASVTEMLESYGFKIINMTEMDGLTYFCSQNVKKATKLRA
jgi:hypothetical protein